jgi:hypothetical protein
METITISINNETGRKLINEMKEKQLVTIVSTPDLNSLIFPGKNLTDEQFKNWIQSREKSKSMSLKEAKAKWAKKEKQLLAHGR